MTDPCEHTYPLTYTSERRDPPLSRSEALAYADEVGGGACDAVLVASVIKPAEGGFSALFVSRDGTLPEDGPLSANDRFKVWCLMARYLADDPDLSEGKRELCEHVFGAVRAVTLQGRG